MGFKLYKLILRCVDTLTLLARGWITSFYLHFKSLSPFLFEFFTSGLQVSGAGIILWDDFWKSCSRLMTGSSLESIMHDDRTLNYRDGPPLLITQFGEDGALGPPTMMESDEELAKKLAAEWGTSVSVVGDQNTKSDEDYARELQAQWDAEVAGQSSSVGANDFMSQVVNVDDVETLASVRLPSPLIESKVEAETDNEDASIHSAEINATCTAEITHVTTEDVTPSKTQKLDFEKLGLNFPLYHYNGLRGGCLTPFRVTRLSPDEAVGASIALSSGGGAQHRRAGGGDLEDVVRTKWPSCIFNWLGKQPPYID